MTSYIYREDSGYAETYEAADDEAAIRYAEDLLRGGGWGQECAQKTLRVTASVIPLDGAEELPHLTASVIFEPPVPRCPGRDDHDWAEGPSYGSGGGVRYISTCGACGLQRTTDTWDHDHATGEVMETVAYEIPVR